MARFRWLTTFRFSLRTLLVSISVIAFLAGWVAYYRNWARQRDEYIASDHVNAWLHPYLDHPGRTSRLPLGLRIVGAKPLRVIALRRVDPRELARVKKLFPEAFVDIGNLPRESFDHPEFHSPPSRIPQP